MEQNQQLLPVREITSADNMAKKFLKSPLLNVIIDCHGSNASGLAIGGREFPHLDTTNVATF